MTEDIGKQCHEGEAFRQDGNNQESTGNVEQRPQKERPAALDDEEPDKPVMLTRSCRILPIALWLPQKRDESVRQNHANHDPAEALREAIFSQSREIHWLSFSRCASNANDLRHAGLTTPGDKTRVNRRCLERLVGLPLSCHRKGAAFPARTSLTLSPQLIKDLVQQLYVRTRRSAIDTPRGLECLGALAHRAPKENAKAPVVMN